MFIHGTWNVYTSPVLFTVFYIYILLGAQHGLSLELNIEQYEYTVGDKALAGVKVQWQIWYVYLLLFSKSQLVQTTQS